MRCHKKTKESGFFESDSDSDIVTMGKVMKRTNGFASSGESRRKICERVGYTQEELDTHIRPSKKGKLTSALFWLIAVFWLCFEGVFPLENSKHLVTNGDYFVNNGGSHCL